VARVVRHRGGIAAHDAGERFHSFVIGDHADLSIDFDRGAVEQLQLLARPAPAHLQAAVDLVEIEDV
jgi:hypothetical protein